MKAELEQQLAELASEANNDEGIDHSVPHEPTDYERAVAHVQGIEVLGWQSGLEPIYDNPGYRPCNCEDYPCCGH